MLLELFGFIAVLVAVKYFTAGAKRPPPHVDSMVGLEKDGPYHVVQAMRDTVKENVKLATYPLLRMLGLNINLFMINDPADVRALCMKNDNIHGRDDIALWWDLLSHYRKLQKGYKAEIIHSHELGIMRNYDPAQPETTKIGKLIRRRTIERLSKKSLEPRWVASVDDESEDLQEEFLRLGKNGTVAIEPLLPIVHRTLSVICQFTLGLDVNDERIEELTQLIQEGLNTIIRLDKHKLIFMFIPRFIRNFIPLRFWPEWCNTQQRFYDLIIEMVEEHNESWKVGEEAHCLIGVLEEDRQAGRITESDVIHTIFALFLAGADTIATGLTNTVLNFARYPEVQQKCYEELKAQNFQSPNLTDCPYHLATVWESARYTTSVYRTLIHSVTQPTDVLGHDLSKGDFLTVSLYGIHMSDKYFKEPYTFNPERFLVDGVYHKDNNLMPFGVGKRSCPGQILALIESFHFAKNILRLFDIQMDPNIPLENDSTQESHDAFFSQGNHAAFQGHFLMAKETRVRFVPRKD